jgi:hypothetical protein
VFGRPALQSRQDFKPSARVRQAESSQTVERTTRQRCSATRRLRFITKPLYRELQFLGRPECHFLACLDLNGFAGGRIASHPRWPFPHLQDAKTRNSDSLPFLKMLCNEADHVIEQRLALSLCQLVLLGQNSREMLESNWTTSLRRSGCFCLSCYDSAFEYG